MILNAHLGLFPSQQLRYLGPHHPSYWAPEWTTFKGFCPLSSGEKCGDNAGGKIYNIPVLCNELFQGNEVNLWPYSLKTCVVILYHLSTLSFNPLHSKIALDWQKAHGVNNFVLCL